MHATGAQSQATATAAATFTTATVVVVVAVLLLLFLLQVVAAHPISDCWDCELWTVRVRLSKCNRFWAGRGSLLTYIGRIAHRLPPLPAHPLPFLCQCLCSNLTNLHAPENSIQVGEWKVARAALNRLLDMEKLQLNGAGRSTRGEEGRGELTGGEMAACDWRVNNAD